MAVELNQYAYGDLEYIDKMNQDNAAIEAALNTLSTSVEGAGSGGDSGVSFTAFIGQLFGGLPGLIGPGAYLPTPSGSSLTVAIGAAYKPSNGSVVRNVGAGSISFSGAGAGTYYLSPDATGVLLKSATSGTDDVYSVFWTGAAFNTLTRLAKSIFDSAEADNSRKSAVYGVDYATLDARLEMIEAGTKTKTIGLTLEGANLVVDAVRFTQIPVGYVITGWLLTGDASGSATVAVDFVAGSAPPAAPGIPNTTTDKISASAPMALSAAQTAAGGASEITTWSKTLTQWGSIQFHVVSLSGLTRLSIALRVQPV